MSYAVARVAVENAVYHFDKEFSYLIPPTVSRDLAGCRVVVPFGRGNARRQGLVISTDTVEDGSQLKEIADVLDGEDVVPF